VGDLEYRLSEANYDHLEGFFASSFKKYYDFDIYDLGNEVKDKINGLTLSENEVNAIIEYGILNKLLWKSRELKSVDGFTLLRTMEKIDKYLNEGDISNVPNEIDEFIQDPSFKSKQDQKALAILKNLYQDSLFLQYRKKYTQPEKIEDTRPEKTGAQKIIDFVEANNLSFQDLMLAVTMLAAREGAVLDAKENMVDAMNKSEKDKDER